MTACTNNGGKARRVVTAALVGVLSVGAVPAIALATGTGDVSLQSVSPWNDVTLVSAQDGTGHSVSKDALKTGVSFENGNKQYLVPTWVSVKGAEEKVDSDWTVEYIAPVTGSHDSTGCTGFEKTGVYYEDAAHTVEAFRIGATDTYVTLSAEDAQRYFTGKLYDGMGKPVKVQETDYRVQVRNTEGYNNTFSFKIVAATPEEKTYTVEGNLYYDGKDKKNELTFRDEDGLPVPGTITWYKANGAEIPSGDAVENAGSYKAKMPDGTMVDVEVLPVDLSAAEVTIENFQGADANENSFVDGLKNADVLAKVTIDGETGFESVIKVAARDAVEGYKFGPNTVTISPADDQKDSNIKGSKSVTFTVYKNDVVARGKVMYGDMDVTSSGLFVNLFKGERFDASKLYLVGADGTVYKDVEVTYDGDLTKETNGAVNVTVSVKPFQKNTEWCGGSLKFDVTVTGADIDANQRLYFYLDGKLTGDYATVTYDGEDWLKRLEVVVKDADGNEIDPSNYDVKVTKDGKEVDSVVDHGDYEVKVTGKTFTFDGGVGDTLYLTVDPLEVDRVDVVPDLTANGTSYLTWTGEELKPTFKFFDYVDDEYVEVEVPAEAYEVTYVRTKPLPEKKDAVVKDEGTYVAYFDAAVDVENYRFRKGVSADFDVTKKGVFLDVPMNEWYSQGVYEAAKLGYMNGDGAGATFSPMRELTRAEAACVLFNMAGGDTMYSNETIPGYNTEGKVYETGFSDVAGNEFFAKAVAWCKATGIINGYADGTFGVSRKVTNEEFACMLANYAKAKGDYKAVDADETLAAYPDADVVSDWAKDAVAWCVSQEIMGGGANISPAGSILRMRAATMAVNAQPKKLTDLVIEVKPNNPVPGVPGYGM